MPSAGLECPIRRRRTVGPTLSLLGADDTAVTLSLLSADDTADKGIVNYHTLRVAAQAEKEDPTPRILHPPGHSLIFTSTFLYFFFQKKVQMPYGFGFRV